MSVADKKIPVPEADSVRAEGLEGIDFIRNGDQYLSFCLGRERYGVDILNVTEIRGWEQPTRIPGASNYVKGVVNIRGIVIPIIDLRLLFDVGDIIYEPTTVVVILAVKDRKFDRTMGFVVDAVSDVIDVESRQIKPVSSVSGSVPALYMKGCCSVSGQVISLLSVDQLIRLDLDV